MRNKADEILKKYEDENEYHLHEVDRKWIIDAMIEFSKKIHKNEIVKCSIVSFKAGTEYLSTPEQAKPFAEEYYELNFCGLPYATRKEADSDNNEIEEAAASLANPNVCKTTNWEEGAKWQREKFIELSDEEIMKGAEENCFFESSYKIFAMGARWYREKIK